MFKGLIKTSLIFLSSIIISGLLYNYIISPTNLHWGLDKQQAEKYYSGDELLDDPDYIATHGVNINASPEKIWPWIVQIGQNRAGFYSYTILENFLGFRMKNSNRIVREWQILSERDEIFLSSSSRMIVESLKNREHIVCSMPMGRKAIWGFYIIPIDKCNSRLISRFRLKTWDNSRLELLTVDPGHFIMDRKMLTGIKDRVENGGNIFSSFSKSEWIWGIAIILLGLSIPILFFYHKRPLNGISAGLSFLVWSITLFSTYASILIGILLFLYTLLIFVLPKKIRS